MIKREEADMISVWVGTHDEKILGIRCSRCGTLHNPNEVACRIDGTSLEFSENFKQKQENFKQK